MVGPALRTLRGRSGGTQLSPLSTSLLCACNGTRSATLVKLHRDEATFDFDFRNRQQHWEFALQTSFRIASESKGFTIFFAEIE